MCTDLIQMIQEVFDHGSVSTKHLRAKCGEAVKLYVEANVADLRKRQTWFHETADPQLTAVYAESQDESRERHHSVNSPTFRWETLQLNVTSWATRFFRDGFCQDVVMRFCASLNRGCSVFFAPVT